MVLLRISSVFAASDQVGSEWIDLRKAGHGRRISPEMCDMRLETDIVSQFRIRLRVSIVLTLYLIAVVEALI